jgi:uracil-DNA glycosylase
MTTILNEIQKNVPCKWEEIFLQSFSEIEHASIFVEEQEASGNICLPPKEEVFNAFIYTPPEKVKVVILGQDPYHSIIYSTGKSVAHGLSFSTRQGAPIPSSLKNIFKEISRTYPEAHFESGELIQWAEQGVLLLNTCLTVNQGAPKSHGSIWLPFISKILKMLQESNPHIIYVLWGNEAIKIGDKLIM